jgi:hypothetical protein
VVTVVVDAENVRRSTWPNVRPERLVELVRAWAKGHAMRAVVVFDGRAPVEAPDVVATRHESADDWIARNATSFAPYWLVTSDRRLRERAGGGAERIVGGGSFLRELEASGHGV